MGACGVPTTATSPAAATGRATWTPILGLLGIPMLLYVPLLGYRWDYLSHFLIGAGTVFGIVGLSRLLGWSTDGIAAASAAGVFVVGAMAEHQWFGELVFDWADIGAGGLGACCAAVAVLGDQDRPAGGELVALSLAAGVVGLFLRFGVAGPQG
jgi:hypothetical protein